MEKFSYSELIDRLKRLDEEASFTLTTADRCHVVIVGGSALILQKHLETSTHDIDAISASRELFSLLEKYDINTRVQAYINNFPYNYEDRLVPIFTGRKVDYFTVSLEDIVVAKLYASRPQDIIDISSEDVLNQIDWSLLEKLVVDSDEARASALNDQNYNSLLAAYASYAERYKPCDN